MILWGLCQYPYYGEFELGLVGLELGLKSESALIGLELVWEFGLVLETVLAPLELLYLGDSFFLVP
jgi:hypothetical protein